MAKPEGALKVPVNCDLSVTSLEDGLIALECFPICTLRINKWNLATAQHIASWMLPSEDQATVCPRVVIVIDPTYDLDEWSVEYNGKIWWSPGAC